MTEKLITNEELFENIGRTWLEIDVNKLIRNFRTIQNSLESDTGIIVVLKANGYGHGAIEVARVLSALDNGPTAFAVASLDEGLDLRKSGITEEILLLSANEHERSLEAILADLSFTVPTLNFAHRLNDIASKYNRRAKIHLKLDTGMGRLGLDSRSEDIADQVLEVFAMENLNIRGLYTHFSTADGEDYSTGRDVRDLANQYFDMQLDLYMEVVKIIEEHGYEIPMKHVANSGTIIAHKNAQIDAVRVGILAYGVYPSDNGYMAEISPALSWKTRVIQVKDIKEGYGVSYNRQFIADKDMTIAVLPIGYADGYSRNMGGVASVEYNGVKCPVIGVVCMDILMIDCSNLDFEPQEGDIVDLIVDHEGREVNVYDHAKWQDTIPYEVYTSIAQRVPRVYKKDDEIYKIVRL